MWTHYIHAQVKKPDDVSETTEKIQGFPCDPENVLFWGYRKYTDCISLWYGNCSAQARKALQSVVHSMYFEN